MYSEDSRCVVKVIDKTIFHLLIWWSASLANLTINQKGWWSFRSYVRSISRPLELIEPVPMHRPSVVHT